MPDSPDSKFKFRKFEIEILTPVHIGCNSDYNPFNSCVTNTPSLGGGYRLIKFSPEKLSKLMREKGQRLLNLIEKNDLREIQRYFSSEFHLLADRDRGILRLSDSVGEFIKDRLGAGSNTQKGSNQLQVLRNAFNPHSDIPYIPGSSIKGSIRTALVNEASNKFPEENFKKGTPNEMEDTVLERIRRRVDSDPFKQLFISDASNSNQEGLTQTVLFEKNIKKNIEKSGSRNSAFHLMLEVLDSYDKYVFDCHIREGFYLENQKDKKSIRNIQLEFDFASIAQACNSFYGQIFDDEMEVLENLNIPFAKDKDNSITKKITEYKSAKDGSFLLRVGRHSGAEALTLAGHRAIKVRVGKNTEIRDSPTTLWLASRSEKSDADLTPFGWVGIRPLK